MDIPLSIKGINEAIKEIEAICLRRIDKGFTKMGHYNTINNSDWLVQGFVDILEILEVGYMCFCGKFNIYEGDMCNHSPDDEEEWRNENE